MEVFRLSREQFAKPLSGKGAALVGARWNSIGFEMIYTAQNRSLAMAEVAVHFTLATIPTDYVMTTIFIPSTVSINTIAVNKLPLGWNVFPHLIQTQKIGDGFILKNDFCILKVPSAVTQGDFNFLINPNHKDFKFIKIKKIEKFPFDNRIFQ